jgi:hypothetical protein
VVQPGILGSRCLAVIALLAASLIAVGSVPDASATTSASILPAGTAIDASNAASVTGAYELGDGRTAVPLRSARPDWVTPELLEAARKGPTPAPPAAIADIPASGYVGIRPGSEMIDPYGCTMDFVFFKNGAYAIATAGHCVDRIGQEVTLLTVAPATGNPVVVTIGSVVARVEQGIGNDVALVAIKPELQPWVFPTIAQVGGPCDAYLGDGLADVPVPKVFRGQAGSVEPEVVAHYGHGLGVGTGGTARTGIALYWGTNAYYWDSPSAPGDSGSPVRVSNLAAAGNLTHLVVDTHVPGAIVAGTRIGRILQVANGYALMSSEYC